MIKGHFARSVALAQQKVDAEKLSNLASKNSALETEIATMRSSEARFLKHQGELESQAKAEKQRTEDFEKMLEETRETLRTELARQEKLLIEAIENSTETITTARTPEPIVQIVPTPVAAAPTVEVDEWDEDDDFVPIQPVGSEGPQSSSFEGFGVDNSSEKAESAANALRAALDQPDS